MDLAELFKKSSRKGIGGQPHKFKRAQDLEKACENYFKRMTKDKQNPTIAGLSLYLGYADRQSIRDIVGNEIRPQYSCVLKRALLVIKHFHELRMTQQNSTGSIFMLKVMGYVEAKDEPGKEGGDDEDTPKQVFKIGTTTIEFT